MATGTIDEIISLTDSLCLNSISKLSDAMAFNESGFPNLNRIDETIVLKETIDGYVTSNKMKTLYISDDRYFDARVSKLLTFGTFIPSGVSDA